MNSCDKLCIVNRITYNKEIYMEEDKFVRLYSELSEKDKQLFTCYCEALLKAVQQASSVPQEVFDKYLKS